MDFLAELKERICAKSLGPVEMSGLLKELLVNYYSNPDNIQHPALKNRVYSEGSNTRILIEIGAFIEPALAEDRPAILISRGDWKAQPPTMEYGAVLGSSPKRYVRQFIGTHNINCIGKTYGEAEILAEETFKFLIHAEPLVAAEIPIANYIVNGLAAPKPVAEGRVHYIVAIPIQYSFSEAWTITFNP